MKYGHVRNTMDLNYFGHAHVSHENTSHSEGKAENSMHGRVISCYVFLECREKNRSTE